MRAKDVMTDQVLTVKADASLFDTAELMVSAGVSALPVVDDTGRLIGIVSEADVIYRAEPKAVAPKPWFHRFLVDNTIDGKEYAMAGALRVADIMTKSVVVASERWPLAEIAALMQKHKVKCIPIVRTTDGAVIGIVSRANVLQGLLSRNPCRTLAKLVKSEAADEEKRVAITTKFNKQTWSATLQNNVVVQDGVVHLWGYANNDTVRKACEVAAETVRGVRRVENHMVTMPPVPAENYIRQYW